MSRSAIVKQLPWENRWTEPKLEELLKPVSVQRRRLLEIMIEALDQYDSVTQNITWYGPGWNWTVQYVYPAGRSGEPEVLCYLVPNVEGPIVCVPLSDDQASKLPHRRLNKYVRLGIRQAKCAVKIHWATYTPTNQTEVAHLLDLIKRKNKIVTKR